MITNPENHGKGYVVRQGMLRANGKYRLFTDADSATPIEEIEKLLPFMKGTRAGVGSGLAMIREYMMWPLAPSRLRKVLQEDRNPCSA